MILQDYKLVRICCKSGTIYLLLELGKTKSELIKTKSDLFQIKSQ